MDTFSYVLLLILFENHIYIPSNTIYHIFGNNLKSTELSIFQIFSTFNTDSKFLSWTVSTSIQNRTLYEYLHFSEITN